LKWRYLKEIKTFKSIKDFKEGIRAIKQENIIIQSITIDGKRGYINNIKKLLGNIPIQIYLQILFFICVICVYFTKKLSFKDISLTNTQSSFEKDLKDLKDLMNLLLQARILSRIHRLLLSPKGKILFLSSTKK
jgi:hypothetical protein